MFVTDTHPLIWYTGQKYKKLSAKVHAAFQNAVEGKEVIYIPTVVLWEISLILKSDPEELELGCTFNEFLERLARVKAFVEEPITNEIVGKSHDLQFHTDPFDTLIVATALVKEMPLITDDSIIHKTEPCVLYWD